MNPITIIIYVLFAVLAGKIAQNRGRSFGKYFLLSFLFSPLIMTIVAITQPKVSDAEQMRSDTNWFCPNCETENDASFLICRKCGTARPVEEKEPTEMRNENMDIHSAGGNELKETKKWFCPECGTENDNLFLMCRKCGAAKPVEKKQKPRIADDRKPQKEGNWFCAECGTENDAMFFACRKCGADRPENKN